MSTNLVSLKEYRQRKTAEAMVVPCGTGKVHITWTPKLSIKDIHRLRKVGEQFKNTLKEFQDAGEIQLK